MTSAKSFGTTDYSGYLLTLPQANRYSNASEKIRIYNRDCFPALKGIQKSLLRFGLLSPSLPAIILGSFTTTLAACSIHP